MRRMARWLGGVCVTWMAMGCSAADRDLIGDLIDGIGDGHSGGGHGGSHSGGGHGGGGGGDPGASCGGAVFSYDDVYLNIATDLARLDADDAATTRYFTLGNEASVRGCGAGLDESRAALNKLINSVSVETTLQAPTPIDADLTIYSINLRDYGWDRPIEVNGTVFADGWEALIASSPYAVELQGDDADDAKADTGTTVPVILGSAFVAAASSAPLYYALLGIPEDLDAFIANDLQIDVAANLRNQEVVRAGLDGTGLGRNEFLVERHDLEIRAGYLWQIFSDVDGAEALLDDPLGTPAAAERELVFTLPNGLLGHALADADGQRLDDSEETLDPNETNFRAKVAHSFMRLRPQGVSASDSVRQFVEDNAADFSAPELAALLAIYPEADDLQATLESDRQVFADALLVIGLDIGVLPEPVGNEFSTFDLDVNLRTAAGDFFTSPESLELNLVLLDPAMGVLDGGTMDRDDFSFFYRSSLCILSTVNENTVVQSFCE